MMLFGTKWTLARGDFPFVTWFGECEYLSGLCESISPWVRGLRCSQITNVAIHSGSHFHLPQLTGIYQTVFVTWDAQ